VFVKIKIILHRIKRIGKILFKAGLKTCVSFATHFMSMKSSKKNLISEYWAPYWYLVKLVMGA
jgi:hypothetical protein